MSPGNPTLLMGWPRPFLGLMALLGTVGVLATSYLFAVPFETAAFGGLTVPTVLAAGFADGFNPCAFAFTCSTCLAAPRSLSNI